MYMFAISQYGTSYVTAVYDITEACDNLEYELVDDLCVKFINVVNTAKGMGPVKFVPGQRSDRPAHDLLSHGITWYENRINVNLLAGDCYFIFFEDISDKVKIATALNDSVYYTASSTSDKGKHSVTVLGDKLASLCDYVFMFDDKISPSKEMDAIFIIEDKLNDYSRYICNSLGKLKNIFKFIKERSDDKMIEYSNSYSEDVYTDATGVLLLIEGTMGTLHFAKRFNKADYANSLLSHEETINSLFDKCERLKKKLRLMNVYMEAALGQILNKVADNNVNDESHLKIVVITEIEHIYRYRGVYSEALIEMSKREDMHKLIRSSDEDIISEFKKRLASTFKYLYAEKFLGDTWEDPNKVTEVFKEIMSKVSFKVAHTIDDIYAIPNENGRVHGGYWYDIRSGVTMGLLIKEL